MNAVMHPPSAYVKAVYQTDISVRPHTSLFDTGLQVPLHKYLNDIEIWYPVRNQFPNISKG